MKFNKLTRANLRALPVGKKIMEHGIRYEKVDTNDGRFEIDVMVNRKRIHRSLGLESEGVTREQAEQAIEKLKTEAREERFRMPKGRKVAITFTQAAKDYMERLKVSEGKDLKNKRLALDYHLIPFFGQMPLTEIKTFDVSRFKKARVDAGAQNATINCNLAVLSHLLSCAVEWSWITHKDCTIKTLPVEQTKVIYMTHEQCAALLLEAEKHTNKQLYPFVKIGLDTGMRYTEILSVRFEHIDLDALEIYIPKAKAGPRRQPISPELAEYLKVFIADKTGPWLFPSKKSRIGRTTYIQVPFREIVTAAGMDAYEVTRHTMRHTLVTHLKQAGVDDKTIMEISGHKSHAVMNKYSHTSKARVQDAMTTLAQLRRNSAEAKKPESDNVVELQRVQ